MNTAGSSFKTIGGRALELFIVLGLGFGLFIWSSTHSAMYGDSSSIRLSDAGLYTTLFYELFALSVILFFLRRRNWRWQHLPLSFHPRMVFTALLLVILRLALGFMLYRLLAMFFPVQNNDSTASLDAGWLSIILIIIINSVYEEVLLMAYIFKRFEGLNPAIPFFISMFIRLSYHTYQGWSQMPMIAAMALVFGLYYMKYHKLWPLIIAHALSNAFSFLNLHYHWFGL